MPPNPQPAPPPSDRGTPNPAVPPLIQQHDDDALALETAAAVEATRGLRDALDALLHALSLRWVQEFGTLRTKSSGRAGQALIEDLAHELAALRINPEATLIDQARRALDLGVEQGFRESGLDRQPLAASLPGSVYADAAQAAVEAQQRLAMAAQMAVTMRDGTYNQVVLTSAGPAHSAASTVERAARTLVNQQVNAGIGQVADALGAQQVWVAEPDACLTCTALSGTIADADGLFDASLTFGAKPITWLPDGGLTGPPRHPSCRCRITVYFGHDEAGALSVTHDWAGAIGEARANGDLVAEEAAHKAAAAARRSSAIDLPAALRREGERSVLHGWALPSETHRSRARAADRLLARINSREGYAPSGWQTPKSVKKRAETRLNKGEFRVTRYPR